MKGFVRSFRQRTSFAVLLAALLTVAWGCQTAPKNQVEAAPATGNYVGADFWTHSPRDPANFVGPTDWNDYGGLRTADRMGEKFSPLDQINSGNVSKLKKLWVYRTGEKDIAGPKSLEVTPVYYDGNLYGCTIFNKVFALDAETGVPKWEYNPQVRKSDKVWAYKCRGVSLWKDPTAQGGHCSVRVFSSTIDGRVLALDAKDGKPCEDFVDHDMTTRQPIPGAPKGQVAAWINVMSPYPSDPKQRNDYILSGQSKTNDHPFRDEYYITSSPLIFKDLVIVGGGITDNGRVNATAGAVQAFDVRTGELKWVWDPAPNFVKARNNNYQLVTYGTPNVWAPMSADDARGLIFLPTGSAAPDYYGVERKGKDQYANSVIALRVADPNSQGGKLLDQPKLEWQFKAVIQDKWDYDMASQPVLTNLKVDGKDVPVVIQATKMGFVFIMDRETGQPIYPTKQGIQKFTYEQLLRDVPLQGLVPEETVLRRQDLVTEAGNNCVQNGKPDYTLSNCRVMYSPKSEVAGSHSAVQPFPPAEWQLHGTPATKAELQGKLARFLEIKDCTPITANHDYFGMYTPPSLKGAINYPGAVGGVDWGGVTVDPVNQVLYVNQIRIATISKLIPRDQYQKELEAASAHGGPKAFKEAYFDMIGTPYGLHRYPYMEAKGIPCSDPPYGVLKAVSLKDGRVLWEKPFGSFAGMAASIAADKAKAAAADPKAHSGEMDGKQPGVLANMIKKAVVLGHSGLGTENGAGVPNFGGSLVTAGKVLFIAAAADNRFRMYHTLTGQLIKEIKLDELDPNAGAGAATPMTFMTPNKRQIVVVASGGNKFIPGKQGDAIIAFGVEP